MPGAATGTAAGIWRGTALALLACAGLMAMTPATAAERVLIIEGLAGEPGYARQFDRQVQALASAARGLDGDAAVRVLAGEGATRTLILAQFRQLAARMGAGDQLVVWLVGHGSFDGRQYKFNVPGTDLTDADLKKALQDVRAGRQLLIVTGSASGALLPILGAPHRVLLTATRNGDEKNVTRFGAALIAALHAAEADTDKDGRISAQEAFNFARRAVEDAYRRDGLLASEHAVLQGDEAGAFVLAALATEGPGAGSGAGAAPSVPAGVPAEWLQRRATLNGRIRALEARKGTLASGDYERQLQGLLLQLARLQQQIDQAGASQPPAAGDAHASP